VVAQPPPIRKRRPVWIISAAITSVVYVVVIGSVVLRQPDPGRSTAAELAAGMQTALMQRDPDAFQSLFARGALPVGYARDLLTQLPAGVAVDAQVVVTAGGRDAVTAKVSDGQRWWCMGWLVEPDGDRVVLTAAPALATC
jgi:hypothetical protein